MRIGGAVIVGSSLVLFWFLTAAVRADDTGEPERLAEIVVTATRTRTDARDVTNSVSA